LRVSTTPSLTTWTTGVSANMTAESGTLSAVTRATSTVARPKAPSGGRSVPVSVTRMRPRRLVRLTSGATRRTRPASGSVKPAASTEAGLAGAHAGERRLGHVGLQLDLGFGDDAEQRLAGGGGEGPEAGIAAGDGAADLGLDLGAGDPQLDVAALGAGERQIGLGQRQGIGGGIEARGGRPGGVGALVEGVGGRRAALLQLAGALQLLLGEGPGRGRLRDGGPGLGDGGFGAGDLRAVLDELDVELLAVEAGEHLAGGHLVAFLGEDRDDGQAVDLGRDHDLVARHEGAGGDLRLAQLGARHGRDGDRGGRGLGGERPAGERAEKEARRRAGSGGKRGRSWRLLGSRRR
jgi:hypothetical protein